MSESIICPDCGDELTEVVDTTYCNYNSPRAAKGQHTGNMFDCERCKVQWLDNFLSGQVECYFSWSEE